MAKDNKNNAITRIIIVSTVGLIYDGITGVIVSYLEAMDRSGLEIYVAGTINVHPEIRARIESLGCRVVDLPSRRTETIEYFFRLVSFIRRNEISVIHAHGNSGTMAIEMLAGWLGGCEKRIAHSHNTRCDQVKADKILRPVFDAFYTDALACGEEAGEWLFRNKPFTVLRNGRSIERYRFDEKARSKMRSQYGLSDDVLVLGHVGHFTEQKNQRFVIDIYREIVKIRPSARLFLIGEGRLRDDVEATAKDLRDNVVFVGTTDRIEDFLQMMDIMVLPSLFEGFPLVSIEWQINGLPAILSDVITRQCALTNLIRFRSLNDSPADWAIDLIELVDTTDRIHAAEIAPEQVTKSGYDITSNATILRKIYCDN